MYKSQPHAEERGKSTETWLELTQNCFCTEQTKKPSSEHVNYLSAECEYIYNGDLQNMLFLGYSHLCLMWPVFLGLYSILKAFNGVSVNAISLCTTQDRALVSVLV